MTKLRDITEEEWQAYEWIEVTPFGEEAVFIRGLKHSIKPQEDGYHYVDGTRMGDTARHWVRAKTPDD